jgi:primosomal protein N' (replication factor Y)
MSQQYCDVALPVPLDTPFTYKIDGAPVVAGGRVIVPFREKRLQGIVLRLHDETPGGNVKLKSVIAALDSTPVLDENLLALGAWIACYYLAPLGEVYRGMLPLGAEFKQVIAYSITGRGSEALYQSAAEGSSKRSQLAPERQRAEYAVLDYLAEGELVREATLRSATGATREILRNLSAKKWIAREDLSRARCPAKHKNCPPERT